MTVDLTQNKTGETFSTPNQLGFLMSRRNLETLRVFKKWENEFSEQIKTIKRLQF